MEYQINKKVSDKLGLLKPQEIELIYLIRTKYRFGSIEIITRDGLPQDILRTIDRIRLTDSISNRKYYNN